MLMVGFGVGGDITLAGTIINEYNSPSKGWLVTLLCAAWPIGSFLTAVTATILSVTEFGSMYLWRILVLIEAGLICGYWLFR